MNQETTERLIAVRVSIDNIEAAMDDASPEELDTYAEELLGMRDEMRTIYATERADFESLAATHECQVGQDDLNAVEETLEAAEDLAEILVARKDACGQHGDAEETKLESFEDSMHEMMHEVSEVSREEEQIEEDYEREHGLL